MTPSAGWVKLHRQVLDNGWLRNPNLWAFWCYCLIKASHKQTKIMVGYQAVQLEAGQFVFGRKKASIDLEMSEQTIRTCVNNLVLMKNITIKSTNKFSIITVVNWHVYQDCEHETNQQINQQVTSNQPATNHKQECKEVKKESSCPKPRKSAPNSISFENEIFQNLEPYVSQWKTAYPATDVPLEISKAASWLIANPKNRKSNYARFLNSWLTRAQDKAARVPTTSRASNDTFKGVIL